MLSINRVCRVLSLCCVAVLSAAFCLQAADDFDISKVYKSPTAKWESKIANFEKHAAKGHLPENAIVCVGSSSMAMWHGRIEKDLAPLTIIKRGFGGSNYNDAITFAHRIITNYKPRAVLVYEGDNDIAQKVSPENVARACDLFVKTLREKLPEVRVYVISVKPSISRQKMWPDMLKANKYMKEYCEKHDYLTFIDVGEVLLNEDGSIKTDIFIKDNLHLNQKGYDLWSAHIKAALMKGEAKYEKK